VKEDLSSAFLPIRYDSLPPKLLQPVVIKYYSNFLLIFMQYSGGNLILNSVAFTQDISPDHDLAIIRLRSTPRNLRPIPVGTSKDLAVGQAVFAIGNPYSRSETGGCNARGGSYHHGHIVTHFSKMLGNQI
jgi:hypothetical protein